MGSACSPIPSSNYPCDAPVMDLAHPLLQTQVSAKLLLCEVICRQASCQTTHPWKQNVQQNYVRHVGDACANAPLKDQCHHRAWRTCADVCAPGECVLTHPLRCSGGLPHTSFPHTRWFLVGTLSTLATPAQCEVKTVQFFGWNDLPTHKISWA